MPNSENDDFLATTLATVLRKQDQTMDLMQSMDKKVDLHIQKTELEFQRINALDEQQNELLDKHIEGVNTLKKWCDTHERANDRRFEVLERPRKWLKMTKEILMWLSAVAGAILMLAKFFNLF